MAIKTIKTIYQFRRDTEANWLSVKDTCIPYEGEPCVTLDGEHKGQVKIGDGVTSWGALSYIGEVSIDLSKYATKEELEVIKIYGESTPEDTSMTIDGVSYDTASEAITAVSDGGTVKMTGGLAEGEVISAEKKFTLDMNNSVVVDNENTPVSITASGDLTLTGNGKVECNKHGKPAIDNKGKLTIEDGSVIRTVDVQGDTYYTMVNHGEMVIEDGIFQAPGVVSSMIENGFWNYSKDYVAGEMAEYPSLTINGGTFINAFYIIKNDDNGKLYINGGNFYGTIFNNGYEMIIKDGNFDVTDGTYNIGMRKLNDGMNSGNLIIEGGTFKSNGSVNMKVNGGDEPKVIVRGGKFSAEVPASYIDEGYEQNFANGYYVVTKKA